MINIENKVGAIGFTNVVLPAVLHYRLLPLYIILVDEKNDYEPIRGPDGLCIVAMPGSQKKREMKIRKTRKKYFGFLFFNFFFLFAP